MAGVGEKGRRRRRGGSRARSGAEEGGDGVASTKPPRRPWRAAAALLAVAAAACAAYVAVKDLEGHGSAQPWRWEVLDAGCGLQVAHGFVAEHEAAELLRLVESEEVGWARGAAPGMSMPRSPQWEAQARRSELVAELERRIAAATGIAPHASEELLSLLRLQPSQPRADGRGAWVPARGGHHMPYGLHHDSDLRPFRARTVIVYLTDVGDAGGRTAFPLCGVDDEQLVRVGAARFPTVDRVRVLQSYRDRHASFAEGLAASFGGVDDGFQRSTQTDPDDESHPFGDLVAEACRGDVAASVAPRVGTAVMFDSLARDGTDPRGWREVEQTWHGGCAVLPNATAPKIILQKFKEVPASERVAFPKQYRAATPPTRAAFTDQEA